MKMGVPLKPLVMVFLLFAVLTLWGGYFFGPLPALLGITFLVVAIVTMRGITKQDDQRLNQVFLWMILRLRNANRSFWGATSYSPTRFKKRK